jgi:hypothetical protein
MQHIQLWSHGLDEMARRHAYRKSLAFWEYTTMFTSSINSIRRPIDGQKGHRLASVQAGLDLGNFKRNCMDCIAEGARIWATPFKKLASL